MGGSGCTAFQAGPGLAGLQAALGAFLHMLSAGVADLAGTESWHQRRNVAQASPLLVCHPPPPPVTWSGTQEGHRGAHRLEWELGVSLPGAPRQSPPARPDSLSSLALPCLLLALHGLFLQCLLSSQALPPRPCYHQCLLGA